MDILVILELIATGSLVSESTWLLIRNRPQKWRVPKVKAPNGRYVIIFPSYQDKVDIKIWLDWAKGTKTHFVIVQDVVKKAYPRNRHLTVITRRRREGYKAGALNYAFSVINKRNFDYAVIFDADHVPDYRHNIVSARTLYGIIEHYNLPVIQFFYNDGRPRKNFIDWLIFAGRESSNWNIYNRQFSTNLIGSGMCFRREIVERFKFPISITEDYALTLRLYKARIPIAVVPISASYGKAPLNFNAYIHQQIRWAEGTIGDAIRMGNNLRGSPTVILDHLLHVNMYLQGVWIFITLLLIPFTAINPLIIAIIMAYQLFGYMYTIHMTPKKYWLGYAMMNYLMMPVQIYALISAVAVKRKTFVRTAKIDLKEVAVKNAYA